MNTTWHRCHRLLALVLGIAGMSAATGCTNNTKPAEVDENGVVRFSQEKSGVPQPGQRLFASPEEAASVFEDAIVAKDRRTLIGIYGREGIQLICAGDRVEENSDMQALGEHMNEYLHVDRVSDTNAIIHVGKENWPFAIPIVKSDDGWFFDTVAGRDELLDRRIGENELNAIAVCRAYAAAQQEYARKDWMGDHIVQYAQHFMSRPGKKDGLYWEVGQGQELSPMGPLVAEARLEGYPASQPTTHKPHPYKGYLFHILTAQGSAAPGGAMSYTVDGRMTKGFAMVASPNAYGASGIMTFIIAKDGKVYQKNLGEKTRELVKGMTEYNPDQSWALVKD